MKIKFAVVVFFLASVAQGAQVIPWGMSSRANGKMSGGQFEQEDTFSYAIIEDILRGDESGAAHWFGVFDGHGGALDDIRTCDQLKNDLHRHYEDQPGDTKNRLIFAFENFDRKALGNWKKQGTGSTAVVGYIKGSQAYIAHVGDSKAVFFDTQGKIAFVTEDDILEKKSEMDRIKKIYSSPEEFQKRVHMKGDIGPDGSPYRKSRINQLPMTRVMGKPDAKRVSKTLPEGDGAIIATPNYVSFHISQSNQFMILATDGIWEVMTPEEAVKIVTDAMADTVENLENKYVELPFVVNRIINLQIRAAIREIIGKNEEAFNKEYEGKKWHEIAAEHNVSNEQIEKKLGWQEGGLNKKCRFLNNDSSFNKMPLMFDLIEESSSGDREGYKLQLAARALREEAIKRGSDDNILVCLADLSKQIPLSLWQRLYNVRYWIGGGISIPAILALFYWKFIR